MGHIHKGALQYSSEFKEDDGIQGTWTRELAVVGDAGQRKEARELLARHLRGVLGEGAEVSLQWQTSKTFRPEPKRRKTTPRVMRGMAVSLLTGLSHN